MSRKEAEAGYEALQLCHALGNTWYLAGWQLIPLYRVSETECILLDSGLLAQRDAIEGALQQAGLRPIGILGTHIHTDHSPNHRYIQQKYQLPVALPLGEAGLCVNTLSIKAYLYMLSPGQVDSDADAAEMQLLADRLILPQETRIHFCGVDFDILHSPGHSPDHIAIRTPDGVLYLGDALLTGEELSRAKLPYFFCHRTAIASMQRLRQEPAALYLAAHRGVYTELDALVDENLAVLQDRAAQVLSLIDRPLTLSEIEVRVYRHFHLLSTQPNRAALYQRNVRIYVEYLLDTRVLSLTAQGGVLYYEQTTQEIL